MASIYDQTLDEVASQVKVLADAIDTRLLPEKSIPVVRLDPESDFRALRQNLVTIAFTKRMESDRGFSNETETYGYPCHVIFALPSREHRDARHGWIQELMEMIPSHFHNVRRMGAVTGGTMHCSMPCKVGPGPPIGTDDQLFHTLTVWAWFEHIRQA